MKNEREKDKCVQCSPRYNLDWSAKLPKAIIRKIGWWGWNQLAFFFSKPGHTHTHTHTHKSTDSSFLFHLNFHIWFRMHTLTQQWNDRSRNFVLPQISPQQEEIKQINWTHGLPRSSWSVHGDRRRHRGRNLQTGSWGRRPSPERIRHRSCPARRQCTRSCSSSATASASPPTRRPRHSGHRLRRPRDEQRHMSPRLGQQRSFRQQRNRHSCSRQKRPRRRRRGPGRRGWTPTAPVLTGRRLRRWRWAGCVSQRVLCSLPWTTSTPPFAGASCAAARSRSSWSRCPISPGASPRFGTS